MVPCFRGLTWDGGYVVVRMKATNLALHHASSETRAREVDVTPSDADPLLWRLWKDPRLFSVCWSILWNRGGAPGRCAARPLCALCALRIHTSTVYTGKSISTVWVRSHAFRFATSQTPCPTLLTSLLAKGLTVLYWPLLYYLAIQRADFLIMNCIGNFFKCLSAFPCNWFLCLEFPWN